MPYTYYPPKGTECDRDLYEYEAPPAYNAVDAALPESFAAFLDDMEVTPEFPGLAELARDYVMSLDTLEPEVSFPGFTIYIWEGNRTPTKATVSGATRTATVAGGRVVVVATSKQSAIIDNAVRRGIIPTPSRKVVL